jgi:hypothetical protein
MEIELKLTVDEVNAILNVLGEMPTKTGVFLLAVKIKQQAEAQLPKPDGNNAEE